MHSIQTPVYTKLFTPSILDDNGAHVYQFSDKELPQQSQPDNNLYMYG